MSTIFPDCYNEWSLCVNHNGVIKILYEGTEEHCREHAYEEYTDEERLNFYLMDWEGREWDV